MPYADPYSARAIRSRRERNARARAKNPENTRIAEQFSTIKRRYGLTADAYHAMFESQGERCAVCCDVLVPLAQSTHIDHDHATERVRALLCGNCNTMLGHANDNAETLRTAASYLEKHSLRAQANGK